MRFRNKYVEKCMKWFKAERTEREKFIVLLTGALTFMLLLPSLLIIAGYHLDLLLGMVEPFPRPLNAIAGLFMAGIGLPFALWSVYVQYVAGKGTPSPMVPTKKLITSGPYKYCRNPMMLGTLLLYVGLALIFNTPSMFLLIVLLFIPLLLYIKSWEEKELEVRFGREYILYRERTPFLIPIPRKHGGLEPSR